jgi:hypothetical protein
LVSFDPTQSSPFSVVPQVASVSYFHPVKFLLSSEEVLICLLSGSILVRCTPLEHSSVILAFPYLNGVAFLTESKNFAIYDYSNMKFGIIQKLDPKCKPCAVGFIKRNLTEGYIGCNDGSLFQMTKSEIRRFQNLELDLPL